MSFYKTSLMIMIVVLIICLSVLGVIISTSESSKLYPPTVADCPDYYVKGDHGICEDTHNIETEPSDSVCRYVNPEFFFQKRRHR